MVNYLTMLTYGRGYRTLSVGQDIQDLEPVGLKFFSPSLKGETWKKYLLLLSPTGS